MQNMSYALIAQLKQTMEIPEESKTAPVTIITTEDAETLHRLGLLAEYTGVESYW